jgi:vacuolar-type H+-ATPase subunit F/Vma7
MKNSTILILMIVLLGGLGGWYWYTQVRQVPEDEILTKAVIELPPAIQPEPEISHPVEAIVVPQQPSEPPHEPLPEPEPLPALADSDAEMSAALAGVAGQETVDVLLVAEGIISRIVATVDSLDSRQVAPSVWPIRLPGGNYAVIQEGDTIISSAVNDGRYANYATLAAAMDTPALVVIYQRYYPLFQNAYEELQGPQPYFNDRLVAIIDHLLATPVVEGPLELVKPEAVYQFSDPQLEALSAGQKVMLRVGGDNSVVIRAKLRELRAVLVANDTP